MNLEDRQSFGFGFAYTMRRRWLLMLNTFLIVLALFVFAGYLVTPTWEAEVLLLAEQQPQTVSPLGTSPTSASPTEAAENLSLTLGGKRIATDMVKKFRLDELARRKAQDPPTLRDWLKVAIVKTVTSPILLLEYLGLKDPSEVDWVDKAVEDFREGLFLSWLDVESMEDSNVVSLKINGETPQLATDVANEMVRRARELLAETTAQAGADVREAQKGQLERVAAQREVAEARLMELQKEQGGTTLSAEANDKTVRLGELDAEASRLRGEIDLLGRQLDAATKDPSRYVNINSAKIENSAVVQNLRTTLHAKEVQLAKAIIERTENHPDVLNLKEEIEGLRTALATEIKSVHRGLITDLARVQSEVGAVKSALQSLPSREYELARLTLDVETYRNLHRELLKASEEMEVMAKSSVQALDFKVLDYAYVSPLAQNDMPSWLIVLFVGVGAGIASAFSLALFLEYWRDPVKGPGDLRRHNIEVLGAVPRITRAA